MSPSGGLRGRRGSILGTAVQLGRRGYDSVHFFLALTTFSWRWTLIFGHKAGNAIPERTEEWFFESKKKYLKCQEKMDIKSRYMYGKAVGNRPVLREKISFRAVAG